MERQELTQHKKPDRIIIPRTITPPIRLRHPKERRNNKPEAEVEESESPQDSVGVGVAQHELPLRGDDHADAGDGEEVAYERCGHAEAAEAH